MSKNKFRIFALVFGALVLAASTYRFYQLWNQPLDTWWTPAYLAQSLEGAKNHVQVLVAGVPIEKALADSRLTLTEPNGPATLTESNVKVRLNNYEHERNMRIPVLAATAAAGGGALVLFLLGLFAPSLGGALTGQGRLTELHLLHEA